MRSVILLSVLALVACGGDPGPEIAMPDETASSRAPAFDANYAIVEAESDIAFSAQQEGVPFEGRFETFDADIRFDADDLDGSQVRVRIPLAGFEAGSTDRNTTVPGKVWFDAKAFPVAEFASDDIRRSDDGTGYVADGTLSLKGASHPLALPFTLDETDGRTVMRAQTTLDRTQWNVGEDPWHTDEYVSRAIDLDITVVAERLD